MHLRRGGSGGGVVRASVVVLMLWGVGCGGDEPGLPAPTPETPAPREAQTPEPPAAEQAPEPVLPPPAEQAPEPTLSPSPSVEPPAPPWSRRLGGPQDDTGTGVAVDGEGRVLWVGSSTPREDEEREPVEGQRRVITLSRYTAAGELDWTREFPRSRIAEPRVGASGDGAVYLSGNAFLYPVDLGLGAADDGFLVRYSSEGAPEWQRRVGQKVHGLAVGHAGEVLVSGEEWTAEAHVPLLTRYAADGSVRWTRRLDGAGAETGVGAVALAASGRAVLTATLVGTVELEGQRFGTEGTRSLAILVFEPDGSLAWGQVLSGVDGRITGVAVGADGSVVVAGESQGAMSWDGTTLPDGGPFLLMMDARGHEGWLRRPACDAPGFVPALALEPSGTVVTACGSTLSSHAPDGTPRGERTLEPRSCQSGACTLTSLSVAPAVGGGWVVTGHQRDGVTTDAWDQDAFLRRVAP